MATAPTQPISKESLLPLPDPEPILPPTPVLVAQCPHPVHDPICAGRGWLVDHPSAVQYLQLQETRATEFPRA